MSQWSLVIYAVAAVWAIQSLLGLMASYRRQRLLELQQAEITRRQSAAQVEQDKAAQLPGLKFKAETQPAAKAA